MSEHIRLSTGPGVSAWIWSAFNLLMAIALVAFAVYAVPMLMEARYVLAMALVVASSVFMIFILATLTASYRRYFWLDGSMLWRKGVFRDCGYDMACAAVALESKRMGLLGPVAPQLVLRSAGRRPVKLVLRNRDTGLTLLPADQLHALADAIGSAGESGADVRGIVHRLRRLADDDF
ncbi:hypothetical protein [Actinomadura sp. 9N407]|uniref:hypothetical protein n=1 Tax=Actinomadura sp. 9N407 TaxID=3375154 RepID=UPI003791D569